MCGVRPIWWSRYCLRPPTGTGATSVRSPADTAWRSTGWSNPAAETVWIHRQRAGVLAVTHAIGREQALGSPLLTGLELDLDDVFSS